MNLFGTYKATVMDNKDPKKLNRVKVVVKGLTDHIPTDNLPWAECRTITPSGKGGSSFKPAVGAHVLVQFGNGDVNDPYYTGGYIETADDLPKANKDGRYIIYSSPKGITITVDDNAKDIEIKTGKYNTTLGTIIDLFLSHTHLGNMGAPTSNVQGTIPPMTSLEFKKGDL